MYRRAPLLVGRGVVLPVAALLFATVLGLSIQPDVSNAAPPAPLPMQLVDQPVLSGTPFSYTGWGDPWVMKDGSMYVMYVTRNHPIPGREDAVAPVRATSTDGVHWQVDERPLLAPGARADEFDYLKVETPTVVVLNGVYHMYYTGVAQDDNLLAIGHATSRDGLNWTKDRARKPILSRQQDFQDNEYAGMVGEPSVMVLNNQLVLYFVLVEARVPVLPTDPPAKMTIWRATALDDTGSRFGTPVKVLEQSSKYPVEQGYEGYSTPAAVVYKGQVHLFYDVYQYFPGSAVEHEQVAIHHAVSTDGLTGWQEDDRALVRRGDAPWAAQGVYSPTVVVEGNDLRMWFSAHNFDWDNVSPDSRMSVGLMAPVVPATSPATTRR